ncbi:hypothetical protein C8R44DRAFT_744037 [Mycena epipterygia]|nr:hypothetical protein C8R44DRAFT_744037 [Mycena epipterygia]
MRERLPEEANDDEGNATHLDGGPQMRERLDLVATPPDLTDLIIAVWIFSLSGGCRQMTSQEAASINIGWPGCWGSFRMFAASLVRWNTGMERKQPVSALHHAGLFLSRSVRHPPTARPRPNPNQGAAGEPGGSIPSPNYYNIPPYLVKYVQELPSEFVIGSLYVQKWGGREHVVEIIGPSPSNPLSAA